ncbi:MAG: gamma-glutamyl-gamma-aminobutyrate hydrolase family protein [Terracidiphilus sp.]|jgi:putative glutamine amidotransferase
MSVRIAIPEPTSSDTEYNQRALPQYIAALQSAGAHAVIVPLHETPDRVARLLTGVQGVLLPGSGFDVAPERYGEKPIPACGPADGPRTAVDELLLQDAFNLHKPILAICHGAQTLNVWRNGTLIQDLEAVLHTPVNHRPGREVVEAHLVTITPGSRLETLLSTTTGAPGLQRSLGKHDSQPMQPYVNSSHHQAIHHAGDNLRVAAVSPADGVIEAVELDSPDHFVLGVQWHPERTYSVSPLSRALFAVFVHAAETWQPRRIDDPVATS